MIRVNPINEYEKFELVDKQNIKRQLKLYNKNGNLYLGPVQALFNRTFVFKDKHRIDFISKIDNHCNELLHVTTLFDKINTQECYSNFTIDMIKEFLFGLGFTEEDLVLKDKTYTCARENFIDFGFNSMNFCLDKKGDIWVHYKGYEEEKQYRDIVNQLSMGEINEFEKEYRKMLRFIRYVNIKKNGEVKCFALKSINITKLYRWLSDNSLIHKVRYVTDIYNDTLRELSFTDIDVSNTIVKVVVTKDGIKLKENKRSVLA